MRRFGMILLCQLALAAASAGAGTFPLTDGTKIIGTAISMNDQGVVFQESDGTDLARTPWDRLSGDALRELLAEAKNDSERQRLEPLVESIPQEVAKRKEIVVKPIVRPERPAHPGGVFALLGSPVGFMIVLVLYGANLLASFEVAVYRHQPLATVCGLAAIPFLGVLSPIIYGAMPTRLPPPEGPEAAEPAQEVAAGPEVAGREGVPVAAGGGASAAAAGRCEVAGADCLSAGRVSVQPPVFRDEIRRVFPGCSHGGGEGPAFCSSRQPGGNLPGAGSAASRPTNSICRSCAITPARRR